MCKPLNEWNLEQWLHDLEHRNIQEIQLGLSRITTVARELNLLDPGCKIITVAGTNGKGSTVAALETFYVTAGYRVGAYTSPHLIRFNERIKVDLVSITDSALCDAFVAIERARHETILTYFEMTTLAALWHFKQHPLDVILLEVGMGGRLDATNIIDADLSIITTIDYDHQAFLGTTLEAIGYEKSGILRQGKPFIYADNNPPKSIEDVARHLACPTRQFSIDFTYQEQGETWSFDSPDKQLEQLPKPAIQLKSAAAAIQAILLLYRDLPVSDECLRLGLCKLFIPGRLQLQQGTVSVLYDVSHNPQSVRLLVDTINKLNVSGTIHAVFSALQDKNIQGLIVPLKGCVDLWYPALLDNKRAMSKKKLLSEFTDAEFSLDICYTSPLIAFNAALKQAKAGDLIIVFGSFFTVGHVMASQFNLLEQKEIQ